MHCLTETLPKYMLLSNYAIKLERILKICWNFVLLELILFTNNQINDCFEQTIFVFKLLETGSIDCLDDPLEQYEPRFRVRNPFNQQKITIR